jgi:hypothetical protein
MTATSKGEKLARTAIAPRVLCMLAMSDQRHEET